MPTPNPRLLVKRSPHNPILKADDVPFACSTVFNTAAVIHNNETLLLFRAEDYRGISHLGLARSRDGFTRFQVHPKPVLSPDPDSPFETRGVEDPRITPMDGTYYITYTGYSKYAPVVCLASTKDFIHFERHGIVTLPENKDAVLFPRKFNNRFAMLTRPVPEMENHAHMWLSYSPDLVHWGGHRCVMMTRETPWWDSGKIGAGAPPFLTDKGWLEIYHGVKYSVNTDIYRLGAALFDVHDPGRLIGRTEIPILGPEEISERTGDVPNVTFSCGATVADGEVRIYYGAGDTTIGAAVIRLTDLLGLIVKTDRID